MSYKNIKETTGTVIYRDLDISFKKSNTSNDVRVKENVDAVKQQLKNLLMTSRGEKPFQPEFDIGIYELLFEPFDDITGDVMKDKIQTAVDNYIDRITIRKLEVRQTNDLNEIDIRIEFNMENVVEPQEINFIVNRRR